MSLALDVPGCLIDSHQPSGIRHQASGSSNQPSAISAEFMRPGLCPWFIGPLHKLTDNSSWAAHRQWPRSRTMWGSRSIAPSRRWSRSSRNARWSGTWAPDRRPHACPANRPRRSGQSRAKVDLQRHRMTHKLEYTTQKRLNKFKSVQKYIC